MTKEERESYLESVLDFKRATLKLAKTDERICDSTTAFFSVLPKSLFKYRSFDEHTVDMITNRYFYLCAAEKLDDPFECIMDIDAAPFFDEAGKTINKACYEMIVEWALALAPEKDREELRQIISLCTGPRFTLDRRKMLDVLTKRKDLVPGVDVPQVVNLLAQIPDLTEQASIQQKLNRFLTLAIESRARTGICALSENPRSQVMWAMYANNYKGYCVEYDFEKDVNAALDTYPVIYEDGRNTNIIKALVEFVINDLAYELSKGAVKADRTQFFRLLLTKSEEWSFQDEWRVLGDAGAKVPAPQIKAIYIGHKADDADVETIKRLSEELGFKVYRTRIDSKSLRIEFDEA